jgi:hypothetical protein
MKLYFVVALRSNFRYLLQEAISRGKQYGIEARILDISNYCPGWKDCTNEWDDLDLSQYVDRPEGMVGLRHFARQRIDSETLLLFLFLPDYRIRSVWRELQAGGGKMGAVFLGPTPTREDRRSNGGPLQAAGHCLSVLLGKAKTLFKPVPDVWVISGDACIEFYGQYFGNLRTTKIIYAHSMDYEQFRRLPPAGERPDPGPVVFLDQGWFTKLPPRVLDPKVGGSNVYPPVTYEIYRSSVNKFLNCLADRFKRRIIVSAHPKAELVHTSRLYKDFEVVQGKTMELVRDASLVLANSSTSIQCVVLAQRSLVLYTSDELDRSIMAPTLYGYADALGAPVVNIDRELGESVWVQTVDEDKYRRFKEHYIKAADSRDLSLWNLVYGELVDNAIAH